MRIEEKFGVDVFADGLVNTAGEVASAPGRLDFGNVDRLSAIGFRVTAQGVAFQHTVLHSLSLQYWSAP